ncbi:MAG: DUF1292 domain-containing protein [Bacilli bacterium]|nr:DUF1292 domain-containing protein [Bacilli bacterium]
MERKITIIENGEKVEYDVILEFTSNENNKRYIAYTNKKKNKDGKIEISLANYEQEENDMYRLIPITDKEELEKFAEIITELRKNFVL